MLSRVRRAAWRVWQEDVSTRPRGAWTDLGGLVCHATGFDLRQWNGAFLTDQAGLDRLDAARAWFADRGVPWGLLVPEELGMSPDGLEPVAQVRLMTRTLTDLPPVPPLDLRWGEATSAGQVQTAAFGDPPGLDELFLTPKTVNRSAALVSAYADGRPVSTATLVVADGVAGVYGVATVPDATRQGYGGAVTLAVLHEAVRRGCDLAMLNPTDAGHPLYARMGFTDGPPWQVWADPEEVSPPSS